MDFFHNAVKGVAQADVSHGAGAAVLFGILFHLSIRRIEFEFVMYHFMAVSALTFFGMIYAFGLVKASLFAGSFNTGVLSSIAVYRLVFHRCRKFPGPLGAKLTRFYAAKLSAKDLMYYKELAKMHGQYGDFVRTGEQLATIIFEQSNANPIPGPREISVLRKSAVPLLYGPNSECLKSTWYGQTGNDPKKCSIHMTRDFNDHRLRRRAWDKGFSIKGRHNNLNTNLVLIVFSAWHVRISHQDESRLV
jgi:hypothetical protein